MIYRLMISGQEICATSSKKEAENMAAKVGADIVPALTLPPQYVQRFRIWRAPKDSQSKNGVFAQIRGIVQGKPAQKKRGNV